MADINPPSKTFYYYREQKEWEPVCYHIKDFLQLLKENIQTLKIDCDFKQVDSYVFANSTYEVDRLKDEVKFLKENNIDVKKKKLKLDVDVHDSYYVSDTYIFNPIKYLNPNCSDGSKTGPSPHSFHAFIKSIGLFSCFARAINFVI